jgi:FlaA1/EpsC-like NDP-sugar epimerase
MERMGHGASEASVLGWRVTPGRRLAFFIAVDLVLAFAACVASGYLRFDFAPPPGARRAFLLEGGIVSVSVVALGALTGAYRSSWSFFGLRDTARIAIAVLGATLLAMLTVLAMRGAGVAHTPSLAVSLIQAPITFCSISGFRLSKRAVRLVARGVSTPGQPVRRALVIGAGPEGGAVIKSILEGREQSHEPLRVVGILDDDLLAHGTSIHGIRVLGPLRELEAHLVATRAEVVIISIPNADRSLVQQVMQATRKVGVSRVRIVPSVSELVDRKFSPASTRAVTLEDLLGRDPVRIDLDGVRLALAGRVVMVTGGAGSIGSELCRQIAHFGVAKLVVLDVDETRLHDIALEIAHAASDVEVVQALVDVRDRASLDALFEAHDVDLVYHAAAYKHVPMMERWPLSALDVNVLGTANVAHAAQEHGAERFVLISTDKAVEPSSIMGASKRLAELVLFGIPRRGMRVSAVRFGNVLGSRGSVLPTFEAQLRRGGPLTVTHPDVERYFMMTSEAVQLVLQASVMGSDREVFVLDMGRPVRILDVAREFLRLNGVEPDVDVGIVFTGLRPGEKLSESLHYDDEPLEPTSHPRVSKTGVRVAPRDAGILEAARDLVERRDQASARAYFHLLFPTLAKGEPEAKPAAVSR